MHLVTAVDDPMPRVRRDMLPDGADYSDTGCELAPSCLNCPFDRCKYDVPGGGHRISIKQRDREIALLRRDHEAPLPLLAHTYGVSLRTVKRALRQHGVSRRNNRLATGAGREKPRKLQNERPMMNPCGARKAGKTAGTVLPGLRLADG